jgi:hypothetical protein
METVQLLPKTRDLLAKCDRPLKEIADGAGVGLEWLKKFRQQADHDFGVNKVQALHDYLVEIDDAETPQKEGRKRSAISAA